jgi:hypothetical protein
MEYYYAVMSSSCRGLRTIFRRPSLGDCTVGLLVLCVLGRGKALAESDSHQIPLNPQVKATLPEALEPARKAKRMTVDWNKAAEMWDEVQEFLVKEVARPQS